MKFGNLTKNLTSLFISKLGKGNKPEVSTLYGTRLITHLRRDSDGQRIIYSPDSVFLYLGMFDCEVEIAAKYGSRTVTRKVYRLLDREGQTVSFPYSSGSMFLKHFEQIEQNE